MQKPPDSCEKKKTKHGKPLSFRTPGVERFGLKDLSPSFNIGNTQGTDLSIYIYKYIHIYILTKYSFML